MIGRAQRRRVWTKLLTAFPRGSRILELSCGTGEDARYLVQQGRSVVACDASPLMIQVAKRRSPSGTSANLEFLHLANEDLGFMPGDRPFDGAFSNFSGLNCLDDLRPFASNLAALVKSGSPVLLCLWTRVCVAEFFWYLLHGQPRKACRRFPGKGYSQGWSCNNSGDLSHGSYRSSSFFSLVPNTIALRDWIVCASLLR